ncbi:hypothetical protein TBLA_0C04150 [Henningerozyma blattae CBS 6284]|uniref:Golgi to ER traffic protein 1 n=1 Tax=Henningerozyma blattae (strain ATCC 34711 / CBS 6284 / DSM 70876 / NBRC 10599 / NRRL Y-10934 / UCD 77-7) TaxID=1071380 RepID=I2H1G3_HENB6|nr:hypothetical protein TBLA_0C04150 [Tetrapisispora blattae CBS 6284]CCH60215.1 hypothetical protein TBLA_0C04150 [Tetrapisispora blattae CBS 6284]
MEYPVVIAIVFLFITNFLNWTSQYHASIRAKLFSSNTKLTSEYKSKLAKRHEYVLENNSISAQDNYAKWTKNNRAISKLDIELKKLKELISQNDSVNLKLFKRLRLVALTVPFMAIKLYYGKKIVYRLPFDNLFPQIMTLMVSKGFASLALLPLNYYKSGGKLESISGLPICLGIYVWALTSVLKNLEFLVKFIFFTEPVIKPNPLRPTTTTESKDLKIEQDLVGLD